MENNRFIILVIICLATHVIRTIYEILKHQNRIKATKTSFVIVFTNMLLLWASWFGLCASDPYSFEMPGLVEYLGIALVAVGVLLFIIALLTIKSLESYEGDLITKGIYSRIRHPMYLAFILWLIGLPVFYSAPVSMALAILLIINVMYWRHLEEIELLERYTAYREYRRTTIF